MGYLLDTHVLLWWLDEPSRLSGAAQSVIADPESSVFVSAATIWEIVIKDALGKLRIPRDFIQHVDQSKLLELPITYQHGLSVADLPMYHNDPFDRMMIAQASFEKLVLVTRDAEIANYDLALLKA